MKWLANCPHCGSRVPRWWFLKRKVRDCSSCSAPIRSDEWSDKRFSRITGAIIGVIIGPMCVPFVITGHFGLAALAFIGGMVIGSIVGFALFGYFMRFESLAKPAVCPNCGLQMRVIGVKCPNCRTAVQNSVMVFR
jgi:hypothetical protein